MRRNQEEIRQLKSVSERYVYTARNHTLEIITCDDNGVYTSSNQNKRIFDTEISNHRTVTVRTCHKEDGIFHYKETSGQGYTKCPIEEEDIFELEKSCRWNKTFPQLKRTAMSLAMSLIYARSTALLSTNKTIPQHANNLSPYVDVGSEEFSFLLEDCKRDPSVVYCFCIY